MAIPAYVELFDSGGAKIEGSSLVQGREGMVEVIGYKHNISLPTDPVDGKITGNRRHGPLEMTKQFDKATPFLFEALTKGKELSKVIIHWYRINRQSGQEEEYMTYILEKALLINIDAEMLNANMPEYERIPHLEKIQMRYEKITYRLVDGNIEKSDSWLEARQA